MSRPSSFPIHDARQGGQLAKLLWTWRYDEHLSYAAIADRLRDRGSAVSAETVRRWLRPTNGATPKVPVERPS